MATSSQALLCRTKSRDLESLRCLKTGMHKAQAAQQRTPHEDLLIYRYHEALDAARSVLLPAPLPHAAGRRSAPVPLPWDALPFVAGFLHEPSRIQDQITADLELEDGDKARSQAAPSPAGRLCPDGCTPKTQKYWSHLTSTA